MPRRVGSIRPLDDRPHRWAARLREISLDHDDPDGAPLRRHLCTRVLHRGRGWALLALAYQDWHVGRAAWQPPRYRLARVQRKGGGWVPGRYTPLSAAHVEALGGSLAEFAADARLLAARGDPRDRDGRPPRAAISYLEHPGAEDDDVAEAYDGP